MSPAELAQLRDQVARARLDSPDPPPLPVPKPPPAKPRKRQKPKVGKRDPFVIWLEKFDAAHPELAKPQGG